jgi:hypothetical protein
MARYIAIDNYSGYIFGDSADFEGSIFSGTPLEYVEALDRSIGNYSREYDEQSFASSRNGASGYRVYRVDVSGSEAVTVVHDGQNQETIDAVETDGVPVCFIESRAMDW